MDCQRVSNSGKNKSRMRERIKIRIIVYQEDIKQIWSMQTAKRVARRCTGVARPEEIGLKFEYKKRAGVLVIVNNSLKKKFEDAMKEDFSWKRESKKYSRYYFYPKQKR